MPKRTKRRCVWCPRPADSDEHIYSQWMRDMLPIANFTATRRSADGSIKTWKTPVLELKTRLVCEPCNNNWGSDLENRMKRACAAVILKDIKHTFSAPNCKAMANFAFKTTVLANHMSLASGKAFFSEQERGDFAKHLLIPSGVQVWIAQRGTKHVNATFRSVYGLANMKPEVRFETYTCTFALGLLILQLLATRWTDRAMKHAFSPPPIKQPDALNQDIIRIFPNRRSVEWPPPHLIGNDLMDIWFWRRFDNINVPTAWISH